MLFCLVKILKIFSHLTTIINNTCMFGMWFSPFKRKMIDHDSLASTPDLLIGSEVVKCIDRFTYLESLISLDGLASRNLSTDSEDSVGFLKLVSLVA